MRKKRLGDVLLERGHLSADDLYQAIQEQQGKLMMLGELLLGRGMVSKGDLVAALEDITHVAHMDPLAVDVSPEVLELIPREVALRYVVLPVGYRDGKLILIMAEPQNLRTLDELRFSTGMQVSPRLGFRGDILAAIKKHYGEPELENGVESGEFNFLDGVEASSIEFFTASTREATQEAMKEFQAELMNERTPAVRMVSAIISAAAAKGASDIHIEPQASGTVIRIRVDGILRELTRITGKLQSSLTSRVKVLADMDIAERRAPQDGRFLVQVGSRKLDLRVSSLPTNYGEKVVMRLLDSSSLQIRFEDLGFTPEHCTKLKETLSLPQGMLLVTGPTGSGKTTTLYAALNHMRRPSVNLITVEDPIEYLLEGVNQVQVNTKAGLTFAASLRSILRQDPNVIMVGEVRDGETAEIALKASLTGHFVLSTLHTNDSISAVTRLLDLGCPAYLVASSITGVISQRLTRKLCSCRAEVPATPEYVARMMAAGFRDSQTKMYVPAGCPNCEQTGYRGRVGVYEILLLSEAIRNVVRESGRPEQIRMIAASRGMRFLQEDALNKVRQGLTSLEEVLRVVPFEHHAPELCESCGKELVGNFIFCPFCGAKKPNGAPADAEVHAARPTTRGGVYR